ncbi:glycosyltransferase [Pseudonocardia kujensis]|uniref:glycosyltransferase n=1 Tax=Pseudonocardia kujensis TaxID=1128675 RepID=UPI001E47FB11|nr:glycosyltransferase [Pseudonocardia kujensis]MCE0765815.1 glycosyltransferase [Pseudonocardia kujensis]
MKILILAPGTRGDVAPATGLAAAFIDDGHAVSIVANAEYEHLVTAVGANHTPITAPIAPPTDGATGKPGVRGYLGTLRAYMDQAATAALTASPGVGVVLANAISPYGHDIAAALGVPSAEALLQPAQPSSAYPPMIFSGRDLGGLGNRVAGHLAARIPAPYDAACARIRAELGLPKEPRAKAQRRRRAQGIRVHHGISPAVLPRPADWPARLSLDGFWWTPDSGELSAELEDFLAAGPPPIVVSLGSLPSGHDAVAEALQRSGIRAVVQGMGDLLADDPNILSVEDVPHHLLFPRAAAVVHQAGAGVTASALRAGVPSVPIPMHTDQPFWGRRLAALGAGTAPLPAKKLQPGALVAAIETARTSKQLRAGARAIAAAVRDEDGTRPLRDWVKNINR